MHAMTMLHRLLSTHCPHLHQKRLTSLCVAADAAVSGAALTLSDLGRGLAGRISIKHNIKRIDRLLGNQALHQEMPQVYEALVQKHLAGVKSPVIAYYWGHTIGVRLDFFASISYYWGQTRFLCIYIESDPKYTNIQIYRASISISMRGMRRPLSFAFAKRA